jgi:hypothetical protein
VPQVTKVGRVVVPVSGLGVDVDPEVMGGAGGVPVMFSFRDQDKNHLMIVQEA